jgi:hypothetical protein
MGAEDGDEFQYVSQRGKGHKKDNAPSIFELVGGVVSLIILAIPLCFVFISRPGKLGAYLLAGYVFLCYLVFKLISKNR